MSSYTVHVVHKSLFSLFVFAVLSRLESSTVPRVLCAHQTYIERWEENPVISRMFLSWISPECALLSFGTVEAYLMKARVFERNQGNVEAEKKTRKFFRRNLNVKNSTLNFSFCNGKDNT